MDVIHEVCWKIGLCLCMAIRMGCGGRCEFVDGWECSAWYRQRRHPLFQKVETLGPLCEVADTGVASSLGDTHNVR